MEGIYIIRNDLTGYKDSQERTKAWENLCFRGFRCPYEIGGRRASQ